MFHLAAFRRTPGVKTPPDPLSLFSSMYTQKSIPLKPLAPRKLFVVYGEKIRRETGSAICSPTLRITIRPSTVFCRLGEFSCASSAAPPPPLPISATGTTGS